MPSYEEGTSSHEERTSSNEERMSSDGERTSSNEERMPSDGERTSFTDQKTTFGGERTSFVERGTSFFELRLSFTARDPTSPARPIILNGVRERVADPRARTSHIHPRPVPQVAVLRDECELDRPYTEGLRVRRPVGTRSSTYSYSMMKGP